VAHFISCNFGLRLIAVAVFALLSTGCSTMERLPAVPLALASEAKPLEISDARFYPDHDVESMLALGKRQLEKEARQQRTPVQSLRTTSYLLAISGGGDDGAFGAGLLLGWSARGDRPEFEVVTGISTGALTAPFAFLGREYDDKLRQLYTNTTADDIFEKRSVLAALSDDAMTDTTPLRNMIARIVDQRMISRIAAEYQKGRLLLIMTTNLDQARPVIWNIGAIAASGQPEARDLIIGVLRASASVPGIFPPVMLDITVNGKKYQEMHVDGGAFAQAFLYPTSIKLSSLNVNRRRVAYIIRNGRIFQEEEDVKRQTLAIATQAINTMTASSGLNDTYRIYLTTKRDGVEFNLAFIDDAFALPYKGPFDKDYMRALFAYGYEKAKRGYPWKKSPPGFAE
jgi:hypothetical protein